MRSSHFQESGFANCRWARPYRYEAALRGSPKEELQSTNEQLGTAKEELQSTNEEFTTVGITSLPKTVRDPVRWDSARLHLATSERRRLLRARWSPGSRPR